MKKESYILFNVKFFALLLFGILFLSVQTFSQPVNVSTDKKWYSQEDVIYITVKNSGSSLLKYPSCTNSNVPWVFTIFDGYGNLVPLEDPKKVGACSAVGFAPNETVLFAWTQENYANGFYRAKLKPGKYTVKSIDVNGQEHGSATFEVKQSVADGLTLSTNSKYYKRGETIEITATNKGSKDVEYVGCNMDLEVSDSSGRLLRLNKPGTSCSYSKVLRAGETKVIGTWSQGYYDDAGVLRYAEKNNYTVSFFGAKAQFSILEDSVTTASRVSLRVDKTAYSHGDSVKFYATNIGASPLQYYVCGAKSIKITAPDGSGIVTEDPRSICSTTSVLLPGKAAIIGSWNLVHYACTGDCKNAANVTAQPGIYTAEFEGAKVEFQVIGKNTSLGSERPPYLPSYQNPFVITIYLKNGWNMLSVPAKRDLTLIDSNCSTLVFWNYSNSKYGLVKLANILPGIGYFAFNPGNFCSMTFFSSQGSYKKTDYSISLLQGWNAIGTVDTVVSVKDLKGCSTASPLFTLGADGTYQEVSYIEPGKAYWLKVKAPCLLSLAP